MYNVVQALDRNAWRWPDSTAVWFEGKSYTHQQLFMRVNALAAALRARGVNAGDVVAVLLRNCNEFLESTLAVNRLGAICLPLNFRLAPPEWSYILNDSGAATVITELEYAEEISALGGSQHGFTVITVGATGGQSTSYDDLLAEYAGTDVPITWRGAEDIQRLMYTSGTTSRPKGVPISYSNVLWKIFGHLVEFGITSGDATLLVGPMYHVGAFDLPGIGTWYVGGRLDIMRSFDPVAALSAIQERRSTNIWLAPSMANAIVNLPGRLKFDTSTVRFIIGGGEKMPESIVTSMLATFPQARFSDAYGLTETVSGDTFNDPEHTLSKLGSVGRPLMHLEVLIESAEGGICAPDQSGEILLRGPKVVRGYWRDPEATAAAFSDDGWFRTGDVGHLDSDGYLYIDDRKKDMIVSGGENIAGPEIERVIYEHPAVFEVAVIGIPDDRWGEVPKAYVVLKPGLDVSADDLRKFCRERLAGYKVPKYVEYADTLPRNASGKVLKRELRQSGANMSAKH
jgi:fatty-acyl-CoA synthase